MYRTFELKKKKKTGKKGKGMKKLDRCKEKELINN